MSLKDCGPAVVLIYGDGRLEAALLHDKDGGEPYMGPLLRKAVQYAKTHYDSGNILDVLMAEGEMRKLEVRWLEDRIAELGAKHVYYVTYWWDEDAARKTYHVDAAHTTGTPGWRPDVPGLVGRAYVPAGSKRLV
jgi:hypothetical protein